MDIRYTAEHEWVAVEGDLATVGITDHAQRALGDLVFVQLPEVGARLAKGAAAAVVESVKAASDVLAPLSGTVIATNPATVADPALVNSAPTGAGWLFKIKMSNAAELSELLDESAYRSIAT
ncbi:MAG: glycine cleavage system protein GcvH [Pseudomonadota bacterium]|nr:glycine cleavage system protein GcvH [Pseudomonadota bacterium]